MVDVGGAGIEEAVLRSVLRQGDGAGFLSYQRDPESGPNSPPALVFERS